MEVKSCSWVSTSRSGRDGQSDVSSFPRKVGSNRMGKALKEFYTYIYLLRERERERLLTEYGDLTGHDQKHAYVEEVLLVKI